MLVLGLMSGTSADGVDIALCDVHRQDNTMSATIVVGETYPYASDLRQRILDNCDRKLSRVDEIALLSFELAEIFSQAICNFTEKYNISLRDIDLIGSHGHTLWHYVQPDGHVSATFQIGEGAILAEQTGVTTITNMRARDVACGGQGAPLTGYVDWLLLRHPEKWRAVQNIGGMGMLRFCRPSPNPIKSLSRLIPVLETP